MEEIIIRVVDLPESIGGVCCADPDGGYSIYINAKWGYNGQVKALQHEMNHVTNNDLYNDLPIEVIERRAG